MKKAILPMVVFGAAAALITPKLISTKLEEQLIQSVKEIDSVYGYQAEIQDLQSNWFSTQAKVRLSIDPEEMGIDADQKEINEFYGVFNIDASHGLVLPEGENIIGLANILITFKGDNLRSHMQWPADQAIYQAKLFTGLFNGTKFHDEVSPFSITDIENDFKVDYKGFSGTGTFIDNIVNYTGKSEPLYVAADGNQVTMSGMAIDMNAEATLADIFQSNLYDSNTTLKIASIIAKNESGENNATIKDVVMDAITKTDEANEKSSITIGYSIESIKAEDEVIKDIAFNVEVNNISNAFVTAYQDNQEVFVQGTEEEIQANIVDFAQEHLLKFLQAEPEMNITKLNATFDDGTIMSHVNTRIQQIDNLPNITENPMFWLNHFVADGELQGDKAVIERFAINQVASQIKANPSASDMSEVEINDMAKQQAPYLIENFIEQGLIVKTETGYRTAFSMSNSALKVNGVEIPLPF